MVYVPSGGATNVREAKNVPLLVQDKERMREMRSLDRGHLCLPR